jgi:hypothetical protein
MLSMAGNIPPGSPTPAVVASQTLHGCDDAAPDAVGELARHATGWIAPGNRPRRPIEDWRTGGANGRDDLSVCPTKIARFSVTGLLPTKTPRFGGRGCAVERAQVACDFRRLRERTIAPFTF